VLFYRHGSLHEDSLVDARGRNLWRIREGIASAAFGDIGIAGAPEFFSVEEKFSEGGKVVARDVAGKTVWERQGLARWNSSLALIRKQSAEGASLVMDSSVALKSGEEEDLLIGLRGDGQTVFQRKPAIDLQEFITLNWLPVCPESCLLMSWNDGFYLVRSDGSKVLSKLPGGYVSDVHATPVQFMEGGSPWLAIAGTLNYKGSNFAGLQAIHGALYLFDGEGHPVYHEVLGEECRAVAALPSEDHKSESLLVGGVDKVWQYILTK